MKMNKPINDRRQWFIDRIGKRIFRNKTSCKCEVCNNGYTDGVFISDEMHAEYLFSVEAEFNIEKTKLKYFDTKEEADAYETN